MSSIDRVLNKHGDESRAERLRHLAEERRGLVADVELENNVHEISVIAVPSNGIRLTLELIDLEFLAEEYPDCNIGC